MNHRNPFKYFNSSPQIIKLAVLYYIKYPLSFRQVEDILSERGIDICHETIRFWVNRFGPEFAKSIRKKRIENHFNHERHLETRASYKQKRAAALNEWFQLCA